MADFMHRQSVGRHLLAAVGAVTRVHGQRAVTVLANRGMLGRDVDVNLAMTAYESAPPLSYWSATGSTAVLGRRGAW